MSLLKNVCTPLHTNIYLCAMSANSVSGLCCYACNELPFRSRSNHVLQSTTMSCNAERRQCNRLMTCWCACVERTTMTATWQWRDDEPWQSVRVLVKWEMAVFIALPRWHAAASITTRPSGLRGLGSSGPNQLGSCSSRAANSISS